MKKLFPLHRFIASSLIAFCLIMVGCAPTRLAIKTGYDFSKIKTVAVAEFSGEKDSGKIVQEEFIRQFLKKEFKVKAIPEIYPEKEKLETEIDLLISGTVTRYLPERKFLAYLGENTTDQKIIVYPGLTEIGGTSGYAWGQVFGLGGSQIFVTNATVGIAAKMVDVKSGDIVWADSYTYEGLDVQTATENVVRYFLRSLRKYWKELR